MEKLPQNILHQAHCDIYERLLLAKVTGLCVKDSVKFPQLVSVES